MPAKTVDQLFDWVDFTSDCRPRSVPLSRRNGDVFMVVHHAYNRKVQDTIALSKPGGKTVSESCAMGPTTAGVTSPIYSVHVVPWNTHRPYTTASSIDDKAFTYEVSNVDLNSPFPVAMEAKRKIAEFAAALHLQVGLPLNRWHITSHQEVYARGWGSYATACPGPDLQGALNWIVDEAIRIVAEWLRPSALGPDLKEMTSMGHRQYYARVDNGKDSGEWMLGGVDLFNDPDNDPKESGYYTRDGYWVTEDIDVAIQWAYQWGYYPPETRAVRLERDDYIAQQAMLADAHRQWVKGMQKAFYAGSGGA